MLATLFYLFLSCKFVFIGLGLWCFMLLTTIFQLYRGSQYYSQLTYEGLLDDTFGISCGKLLIFSNITFTISFDYCGFIIIRGIPIFVNFMGTGKPRI
jgi:citrate lyase synthetase